MVSAVYHSVRRTELMAFPFFAGWGMFDLQTKKKGHMSDKAFLQGFLAESSLKPFGLRHQAKCGENSSFLRAWTSPWEPWMCYS